MNETTPRQPHPWVVDRRQRVTFALQAVAGAGGTDPGKQLVAAGRQADALGFDAFFLGDHPAWAPECWLHLAALAVTTERVGLGQMVAAAPYRPPLLTARLASDLDHLSDGRAVLGLGIGWNAADYGMGTNEFDRMGLPYPSTRERQIALEEAIAIIRGAWGAEPFSFDGTFYQATGAHVTPPLQADGPPLILAGGGERTLGQVARLADIANFGPGPAGNVDSPAIAREKFAILRRQCEAAGRPYADILRSYFTHWLILAEDDAALERKIAHYFPDGLDAFWGKYLIAHAPEAAIAYFQTFADAGLQYFVVQVLDPHDDETLRLLAERVAPAIQPATSRDGPG